MKSKSENEDENEQLFVCFFPFLSNFQDISFGLDGRETMKRHVNITSVNRSRLGTEMNMRTDW